MGALGHELKVQVLSTLPIFGQTIQGVSESEVAEGGERMIGISLLQFLLLAALRLTNGKSFHIEQDLERRDDEEWNYRDKVRLCQFYANVLIPISSFLFFSSVLNMG